jgi:hypothetical protein
MNGVSREEAKGTLSLSCNYGCVLGEYQSDKFGSVWIFNDTAGG